MHEGYSYEIVGRSILQSGEEKYTGTVFADCPKEAMLLALAAEFGDTDKTDPKEKLDGWIELCELNEQFDAYGDKDDSMVLFNNDLQFLISVDEVGEKKQEEKGQVEFHVDESADSVRAVFEILLGSFDDITEPELGMAASHGGGEVRILTVEEAQEQLKFLTAKYKTPFRRKE